MGVRPVFFKETCFMISLKIGLPVPCQGLTNSRNATKARLKFMFMVRSEKSS